MVIRNWLFQCGCGQGKAWAVIEFFCFKTSGTNRKPTWYTKQVWLAVEVCAEGVSLHRLQPRFSFMFTLFCSG